MAEALGPKSIALQLVKPNPGGPEVEVEPKGMAGRPDGRRR